VRELVISVLALAVAAFVTVSGIGYVSTGAATRTEATAAASAGFRAYGGALTAYRLSNRALPSPAIWRDELAPYLPGGTPRAPKGYDWSYGHDASGPWFCISADAQEGRAQALRKAADTFPLGAVAVTGACAADGGPEAVAATYRPIGS
jgi:hypothetical protein